MGEGRRNGPVRRHHIPRSGRRAAHPVHVCTPLEWDLDSHRGYICIPIVQGICVFRDQRNNDRCLPGGCLDTLPRDSLDSALGIEGRLTGYSVGELAGSPRGTIKYMKDFERRLWCIRVRYQLGIVSIDVVYIGHPSRNQRLRPSIRWMPDLAIWCHGSIEVLESNYPFSVSSKADRVPIGSQGWVKFRHMLVFTSHQPY